MMKATILALFILLVHADTTVSILTLNDIHGYVLDGKAERIQYIFEKHKTGNSIFVDAGDISFGGTMESEITGGELMMKLYEVFDPSAIVLGNHEFDHRELISDLLEKFPGGLIGSNLYKKNKDITNEECCNSDTKTTYPGVLPYKIVNVGGKKILFIGLTVTDTSSILALNIENMCFCNDEKSIIEKYNEALSEGFDAWAIICHDTHTMEGSKDFGYLRSVVSTFQSSLPEANRRPFIALITGHDHAKRADKDEGNYYISQEYYRGDYVGEHKITFKDNGEIIQEFNQYPTADVTDDSIKNDCKQCSAVQGIIDSYSFTDYYNTFTQNSKLYTCDRKNPVVLEPEIDGLVTYGLYTQIMKEKPTVAADALFYNKGAIRTTLDAGNISFKNIYDIVPFVNSFVTFEMPGEDIYEMCEYQLQDTRTSVGLMQQYGFLIYFSNNKGKYSVEKITKNDGTLVARDSTKYKIITSDFVILKGDNLLTKAYEYDTLDAGLTREVFQAFVSETTLNDELHATVTQSRWIDVTKPDDDDNSTTKIAVALSVVAVCIVVMVVVILFLVRRSHQQAQQQTQQSELEQLDS